MGESRVYEALKNIFRLCDRVGMCHESESKYMMAKLLERSPIDVMTAWWCDLLHVKVPSFCGWSLCADKSHDLVAVFIHSSCTISVGSSCYSTWVIVNTF